MSEYSITRFFSSAFLDSVRWGLASISKSSKSGCQLGSKGGGVGSCEMATRLCIAVEVSVGE